jgi:hypothetical protein
LRIDQAFQEHCGEVRQTPLFAPFVSKMHDFTRTGSGQTWGKLKKEWRFSQVEHDDDFCYTCTEVEVVSTYQ